MTTLTLIRGLPGSGKSTLAKMLMFKSDPAALWFETDQWFMVDGEYKFDASKLKVYHAACQADTRIWLMKGYDCIVSNTFTTMKEMEPYILMARDLSVKLNVIECKGNFGSVHVVPRETMERMKLRWQEFKPLFGE